MDSKYRVNMSCSDSNEIKSIDWFVLPAVQEYYYKSKNLSYKSLPPFKADCLDPSSVALMDIIYPKSNSSIFIPRELDGITSSTLFQVAHRIPSSTVYWHLDGTFIGSTHRSHKLSLTPSAGEHILVLVDNHGEILERKFSVQAISSSF